MIETPDEVARKGQKPIYEVKLIAQFSPTGSLRIAHLTDVRSGPALAAIRAGEWAEVSIPYHTAEAIYGFTVTIANKPAHEPAIQETIVLMRLARRLYTDYGDHAEPMAFGTPAASGDERPQALPDEAEAIAMMARAFKEPTDVIIQAQAFDLFQLIGLIQLATRGLPADHRLHSFARHIGDQITKAVIVATGADELRGYIEMGWNPAYDVVQQNDGQTDPLL